MQRKRSSCSVADKIRAVTEHRRFYALLRCSADCTLSFCGCEKIVPLLRTIHMQRLVAGRTHNQPIRSPFVDSAETALFFWVWIFCSGVACLIFESMRDLTRFVFFLKGYETVFEQILMPKEGKEGHDTRKILWIMRNARHWTEKLREFIQK